MARTKKDLAPNNDTHTEPETRPVSWWEKQEAGTEKPAAAGPEPRSAPGRMHIPIHLVRSSDLNPRKHFDEDGLKSLADSIRQHGLLQPLVVRPAPGDAGGYLIVAGERRWRACVQIGMAAVPALVRNDLDDRKHLELALVENLDRRDIDPLDEAAGYLKLQEMGRTQAQIAEAVNRSQPAVANAIRLMSLDPTTQDLIRSGQLTVSHGIALCQHRKYPDIERALAALTVSLGLSSKEIAQPLARMTTTLRSLLQSKGAVKLMYGSSGHTPFLESVCQQCPFDAFVPAPKSNEWAGHMCCNPAHYAELVTAEEARKAAENEQRIAAAMEERAAAGETAEIPTLDQIDHRHCEVWHPYNTPEACKTGECPCHSHALGSDGNVRDICTDAERFRRLQLAEREAEEKERLKKWQDATQALTVAVESSVEHDSGSQAAVVAAYACAQDWGTAKQVAEDLLSHHLGSIETAAQQFSNMRPTTALRIAAETILRGQLRRRMQGSNYQIDLLGWYEERVGLDGPDDKKEKN